MHLVGLVNRAARARLMRQDSRACRLTTDYRVEQPLVGGALRADAHTVPLKTLGLGTLGGLTGKGLPASSLARRMQAERLLYGRPCWALSRLDTLPACERAAAPSSASPCDPTCAKATLRRPGK